MTERGLKDICAVEVFRRYFCKNVTESLSEKVTSREAIASKNPPYALLAAMSALKTTPLETL